MIVRLVQHRAQLRYAPRSARSAKRSARRSCPWCIDSSTSVGRVEAHGFPERRAALGLEHGRRLGRLVVEAELRLLFAERFAEREHVRRYG